MHTRPVWHGKRRFLFRRFLRFISLLLLLFLLGMAGLAWLFTRLVGGSGQAAFLVWLVGCLVIVGALMTAAGLAARSFVRSLEPLARVMAAADAVSEGNLSVRVPEGAPGEFGRLQTAFNRMVAELERTDQQRRNLTADVAHELRTPLHIIQGNLEGILDGVYTPTDEHIELLLDETRQLARLVEDLRTLSMAEAGQLPLEFEQLDVNELLADVATSFSGQAEAAGVDLRVEASSIPLAVTGDAGRLDQVLSNLVANALRHTSSGGWVRLRAEAITDGESSLPRRGDPAEPGSAPKDSGAGRQSVRICVADSGSGINTDDLPFIFDRFWRGDPARRKDGAYQNDGSGSTGLGLAITRQLVQAHGGRITAESTPGEGTTFTIELPGYNPVR